VLVLDASAALAWIFERTDPAEAERAQLVLTTLEDRQAIVPDLWHIEVINALVTGQRRRVVSVSKAMNFLSRLDGLPIETDAAPVSERKAQIFALAREYSLSAYDATYLDLALRTGAALVSFDRRLTQAQNKAGVPSL
jgi:predicted nucleic acid-binding protein